MSATPGRIVQYVLTQDDAVAIAQRSDPMNPPSEGETYPAMVVRAFGGPMVNLQVFYDGPGSLWVTSRREGNEPGTWHWPPRV